MNHRLNRNGCLLSWLLGLSSMTSTQAIVSTPVKAAPVHHQPTGPVTSRPVTRGNQWRYSQTGTTHTASTTAVDIIDLAPPFQGGSTVTLMIRKRSGNTTVFLVISKGQFTSSFQGGNLRIRFDNKPPATYAFSAAANGATDIIFFDAVQPVLAKLKLAQQTVIDIGFYGLGTRRVKFTTAGLTWKD